MRRTLLLMGVLFVVAAWPAEGRAAGPWVERSLTMPAGRFAFDMGLGLGHEPGALGPGLNLEIGVGLVRHLELGVRSGLRFGDVGKRTDADAYGRMFDTETYDTGGARATLANPEVRLRGQIVEREIVELALEGRVYVPLEEQLGVMFGLPLAFHFGHAVRLDTGVYVPVVFYDPVWSAVSFPAHLWVQMSPDLWLGPLLGVLIDDGHTTRIPLGFGLGYSVTRAFDFKTEFLWRDIANGRSAAWGLGAGFQVRIE